MMRSVRVLIAGLAVVMTSSVAAVAADGDLDPGFSDDGIFQLDFGATEFVSEIVTDDLGHIYAVGADDGIVFVFALLADGTPNRDFGDDGLVLIFPEDPDPDGLLLDFPAAAIDGAGRLVISASLASVAGDEHYWVTRLLPDGAVDPGFAGSGVPGHLLIDAGDNEIVSDVAIDDEDRVLVIGSAADTITGPSRPVVARVVVAGTLDTSYAADGLATAGDSHVAPVTGALDDQDQVLVAARAGDADGVVSAFRLLDDGALDSSFQSDLPDIGAPVRPHSMAFSADGRILVGGYADQSTPAGFSPFLLRMHDDGILDRSLGGAGWVAPDSPGHPILTNVRVDSDGRIIVGLEGAAGPRSAAVLRLHPSGLPDNSFGEAGSVSAELGPIFLGALVVQADGILVGGAIAANINDLYIARLASSAVPAVEFVDDDGSVFEAAVQAIAKAGITQGCNPPANDRFCLNEPVTRGQMAAFLVRGIGYTDDGGSDLFVDDDNSVFETDIDKLGAARVTRGCNPPANDKYCPNQLVTRGEMAALLVRALGYVDDGGGDLFTDDDGSMFESDIDKLGTAGVTVGCNPPVNDRFCPDAPVTRGQMAAFLTRALNL